MPVKVCVIGAGVSGLAVVKELGQLGHDVSCFEKQAREGGLFYTWQTAHADKSRFAQTAMTVSNKFIAFSDYPVAEGERRRFWTFKDYTDYLRRYAEHFGILEHVQFETEILSVTHKDDGGGGGAFLVELEFGGKREMRTFDAVAVCAGAHQRPIRPKLPGEEEFQGVIDHYHTVTDPSVCSGRRVLSIGLGESGADLLTELADVAQSVVVCLRHYPSVIKRLDQGHTGDSRSSRALLALRPTLTDLVHRSAAASRLLSSQSDEDTVSAEWQLRCVGVRRQFFTKSDSFLPAVADGRVKINDSGLRRLGKTSAVFNDGLETPVDFVVLNTGLQTRFDFLRGHLIVENVREQLWKQMILPDVGAKLAFVGFARPEIGGVPQTAELQARYFALLLSGRRSLPTEQRMRQDMLADQRHHERFFAITPNIPTLIDYHRFVEDLAERIGCRPSWRSLVDEPKLLYRFFFATHIAAQYRLCGPGACTEAARREMASVQVAHSLDRIKELTIKNAYSRLFDYLRLQPTDRSAYGLSLGFASAAAAGCFFLPISWTLSLAIVLFALYLGYFGDRLKNEEAVQAERVDKLVARLSKLRQSDSG